MGGGVTSNAVCAVGRGLGGAAVATRIDVAQVERRGGGGAGGAAEVTGMAQRGTVRVERRRRLG